MAGILRNTFILMSVIWLTAIVCLTVGYPQPGFVIFVSYALNAAACGLMALAFTKVDGVDVVRETEREDE
ncbi:hypothetical protein [Thalassobacillus sp. CUG 92003]|uniref:hypothetical protein n=1 Tax=Thalassobacillus sp. CUG 92003 TaxID=2736641 RepID=UPI0015E66D67|nr:hypothetical protein [Thalassobacillus sp. CUG 92003]